MSRSSCSSCSSFTNSSCILDLCAFRCYHLLERNEVTCDNAERLDLRESHAVKTIITLHCLAISFREESYLHCTVRHHTAPAPYHNACRYVQDLDERYGDPFSTRYLPVLAGLLGSLLGLRWPSICQKAGSPSPRRNGTMKNCRVYKLIIPTCLAFTIATPQDTTPAQVHLAAERKWCIP